MYWPEDAQCMAERYILWYYHILICIKEEHTIKLVVS
jgi:hypothetical protein